MSSARFRLRFLLQEIDLPQGDTVIGRSASCQVTIEDPLVSREHARIRILGERATIEDLGSRNGLHVGRVPLKGVHALQDGERVRIGSQEMMFCAGPAPGTVRAGARTTAFMCHCAACGAPYPLDLAGCPACGSGNRADEDTLTGAASTQRDWGLELVVEALKRAAARGRTDDNERLLSHARLAIEQRLASGLPLERPTLDAVAGFAATFAVEHGDASWGQWLLSVYASLSFVPPSSIGNSLRALPEAERASLAEGALRVVESVGSRGGPRHEDREALAGIEALFRAEPVPG